MIAFNEKYKCTLKLKKEKHLRCMSGLYLSRETQIILNFVYKDFYELKKLLRKCKIGLNFSGGTQSMMEKWSQSADASRVGVV